MNQSDARGYEIIIPRSIHSKETHKIKYLPQVTGWRYYPASHTGKPTCACLVCIPSGSIKSRRLRERLEPPERSKNYSELITNLKGATDNNAIADRLYSISTTVKSDNR